MQPRTLVTLSLCLLLAACGGTPADKELSRIHDALGKRIAAVEIAKWPQIAATKMSADVTLFAASEIVETEFSAMLESSGTYDMRVPARPLLNQLVTIEGATLDPKTKLLTKNTLRTELNLLVAKKTLLLNLTDFAVTAPTMLPQPFMIPSELKKQWYGETFASLNKRLAERAKQTGQTPKRVESMLESAFGGPSVTAADNLALWNALHLWNGESVETKDGVTSIGVRSDKEEILTSFRAILAYLRKTGGESWARAEENPDLTMQIQELTNPESETMKNLPQIRGTLRIDEKTAAIRRFDGEILSSSGTTLATVAFDLSPTNDFTFTLTNLEHPEVPLVFKKKSETVTFTIGADSILKGVVSASKIAFTVNDPRTKRQMLSTNLAVKSASKNGLALGASTIELPRQRILIDLRGLTIEKKGGGLTSSTQGTVQKAGKPAAEFSFSFLRTPAKPFTLAVPAFASFERLQSDLQAAFLGMASSANPSPLPN